MNNKAIWILVIMITVMGWSKEITTTTKPTKNKIGQEVSWEYDSREGRLLFTVDLDADPKTRTKQMYQVLLANDTMLEGIQGILTWATNLLQALGCNEECLAYMGAFVQNAYPTVAEEAAGIVEAMEEVQPGALTLDMVLTIQLAYEMSQLAMSRRRRGAGNWDNPTFFGPGCTSFLVCDVDGNVAHGRNLDWASPELFSKAAYTIRWVREGQLVYTSVHYGGDLTSLTAVGVGTFSISLNARVEEGPRDPEKLMFCFATQAEGHHIAYGLMFREMLTAGKSFEEAIEAIETGTFCAPAYVIIGSGSSSEGRIYHRAAEMLVDRIVLNCTNTDWHIAQANDDDKDEKIDMENRRGRARHFLNEKGRVEGCKDEGIMSVLSDKGVPGEIAGVWNTATTFSSVMRAYDGDYGIWMKPRGKLDEDEKSSSDVPPPSSVVPQSSSVVPQSSSVVPPPSSKPTDPSDKSPAVWMTPVYVWVMVTLMTFFF